MLNRSTVERVLIAALNSGGDFSEIFYEETKTSGISAVNGIVEKATSGIDLGVGIRVLNGTSSIYVFSNDIREENLIRLAQEASAELCSAPQGISFLLSRRRDYAVRDYSVNPLAIRQDRKAELLRHSSNHAMNFSNLITQTSASYSDSERNIIIANSEGNYVTDRVLRARVAIQSVATLKQEKQTGYKAPGIVGGFERIEQLNLEEIASDASRIADTMVKAKPCPSGRFPVVIGNGFGGVIFHEACGHALEATSVGIKASVFTDMLGEKIASNIVTAIDDPTLDGEWGSYRIDDESVLPRRNLLIKNGILTGFLVDRLGGRRMNAEPTGSGRRQSYRYAPTSRMSNTFIDSGKDTHDQIIADTELGIYAAKMGGGSVDPSTGEFNFAVTEAYMIRNGTIMEPVRGATLIGKGSEVLMNIDRVGNDLELEQGVCGSVSGNVPANVGQPTIRVSEMTVGGYEE